MAEDEEGFLEWLLDDAIWTPTTYIRPHEYIVRKDHGELFALMAARLLEEGYEAPFQGRTYRYVDVGEYRYGLMDPILNRARGTANSPRDPGRP